MYHLMLTKTTGNRNYCPHVADEEPKAQRAKDTYGIKVLVGDRPRIQTDAQSPAPPSSTVVFSLPQWSSGRNDLGV